MMIEIRSGKVSPHRELLRLSDQTKSRIFQDFPMVIIREAVHTIAVRRSAISWNSYIRDPESKRGPGAGANKKRTERCSRFWFSG